MENYIDNYALADEEKLTLDAQMLKREVWIEMTRLYNKLSKSAYTSNNFEKLEV